MSALVGLMVGLLVGYLIARGLRRWRYRKEWMDQGYKDAMLPYHYRFRPDFRWIARYYDEGYELGLAQKAKDRS